MERVERRQSQKGIIEKYKGEPLNQNLLAYTTGSDLATLTCSNMDDYNSE